MKCPSCKLDMYISSLKKATEEQGGEIKTYLLQSWKCRNRNCEKYDKVVETTKTPID